MNRWYCKYRHEDVMPGEPCKFPACNKDEAAICLFYRTYGSVRGERSKIMSAAEDVALSKMVDHPSHYNVGKYEVIDVIEDWNLNFNLGNAIKYIGRAGHKDDIIQDLEKARWYIDREIQRLNRETMKTVSEIKEHVVE